MAPSKTTVFDARTITALVDSVPSVDPGTVVWVVAYALAHRDNFPPEWQVWKAESDKRALVHEAIDELRVSTLAAETEAYTARESGDGTAYVAAMTMATAQRTVLATIDRDVLRWAPLPLVVGPVEPLDRLAIARACALVVDAGDGASSMVRDLGREWDAAVHAEYRDSNAERLNQAAVEAVRKAVRL